MSSYSLVVSILNPPALTDNFLSHLASLRMQEKFELILVNDGDPNIGTEEAIKAYQSILQPKLFYNSGSIGYGRANNIGAAAASGKVLVFLNTDVFPSPGAITALAEVLVKNPSIGVVQGLLRYPQNGRVQSCGHIFGHYFNNHALVGRPVSLPIVQQAVDRQALTSAFYAVRRSDFIGLNGFDETYLNSHEGMEFSLRLHLKGLRCHYYPKSCAFHVQGGSRRHVPINEDQQLALFWSRWNTLVKPDMDALLSTQINKEQKLQRYLGINLSTNLFWKSTLNTLELSVDFVAEPVLRGHTVVLHDTLTAEIKRSHRPLLFLTDHFSNVSGNLMWFLERPVRSDLILDCHGNAVTIEEVLGVSP